jgi:apolipoprotein N-acyltransferase
MSLSEDDKEFVKRIEAKRAAWPIVRWVILVVGCFFAIAGYWWLRKLSQPEASPGPFFGFAQILSAWLLLGFYMVARTLSRWRGSKAELLLLRLSAHEINE